MKKVSKALLSGALILALLFSSFAVGCGGKEDRPTQTVSQFCDAMIKFDIVNAVQYTNDKSSVESLDIDSQVPGESGKIILNSIKEFAKKTSYKITKEEKTGSNTYNVTVSFNMLNISSFAQILTVKLQEKVAEYYNSTGSRLDPSSEEGQQKVIELMDAAAKEVVANEKFPSEDYECTFKLEKVEDKWLIMDPEADKLTHLLLMGMEKSF